MKRPLVGDEFLDDVEETCLCIGDSFPEDMPTAHSIVVGKAPALVAEVRRLRAAMGALEADWEKACAERDEAHAKLGPRPACPRCGVGGDVGGTEPNPIPF